MGGYRNDRGPRTADREEHSELENFRTIEIKRFKFRNQMPVTRGQI